MSDQILADIAAAEDGLVALYRRVSDHCATALQAKHDLGLARDHFVNGMFRLRRAVESSEVRHG
jgi:hypothetical protein